MTADRTDVSIVIPAYNAESSVGQTVRCAAEQSGLCSTPEIIVVDDGSTDHTAEVAGQAGAHCVRQANAGPAAARNTGFRASHGEVVFFTDSDCLPDPHWVRRHLDALNEPQVGASGGSYTPANHSPLALGIHYEIAARHRRFGRYVRALGSYNLAVRRDVFERVGGFDESYPAPSGEDNDLSYRITEAGFRLRWVNDATVGHFHTEHLGKYLREQFRHGFWRARLYRRHLSRVSGDDYTTIKDVCEPGLVLVFVLSLPLVFFLWLSVVPPAILALLLLMQVPMTVRILGLSRRPALVSYAGVMFLRAFWRAAGLVSGMLAEALPRASRPRTRSVQP